jgi:hypothetical protein
MEYSGLTGKYPVDRRITRQECDDQLHQKQHLDIEPAYQLSVIRMNSTYLELVDKYFGDKGSMTTFLIWAIALLSFGAWMGLDLIFQSIVAKPGEDQPWGYGILALVMMLPFIWYGIRLLHLEAFAYTHYPIRFNRKTRMVHVFRLNGTVLSVPWDEVFFCMARSWEIQGHVMALDGVTVRETFPLPFITGSRREAEKGLPHHWEFIRRYMEEGPEDAYHRVGICMDIADKYETLMSGFHRMHVEGGFNIVTSLFAAFMAITILLLPGRYIAMRTSKIPQWPQEIEAVNVVEPNDPYFRDASMNPKD